MKKSSIGVWITGVKKLDRSQIVSLVFILFVLISLLVSLTLVGQKIFFRSRAQLPVTPPITPITPPTTSTPSPKCLGDVNENGTVEIGDISGILYYWGETCPANQAACVADVNDNGTVEVGDIAGTLFYWNTTCLR